MNHLLEVADVIKPIWTSTDYNLAVNDDALYTIKEKPTFIHPKLKKIKKSEDEKVVLLSAPGAVGKTTFAKYAAHVKRGYYIDLAKIKLGDNTFIGTLAKYFGAQNLSKVLIDIAKGDVSFFIDAFDEAEIISGWEGVENFLREVYEYCKTSPKTNIILFSRAETASMIQLLLEDLMDGNGYSVFEIEYFDNHNAKHFIEIILREKEDRNIEKFNEPFQRVCDTIFKVIGKGIDSECVDIWANEEIRSFIGYSPVLQTIGSYLYDQNFAEVNEAFEDVDSEKSGLALISLFVEKLLEREQQKFVNGLKQKVGSVNSNSIPWEQIFKPERQLAILIKYIQGGSKAVKSLKFSEVPSLIEMDYFESLLQFIPNHPFLRNGNFSSPAFRDYALALLLQKDENQDACRSYIQSSATIVTPLFSHFYSKFSDNKCIGQHVGYIYESVVSRQGIDENIILTYVKKEGDNYTLEIINTDNSKTNHFKFDCIIDANNPLIFERRLHHATIDINCEVVLGRSGSSVELSDVELRATKIRVKAKEITFNCYNEESTYIETEEFVQEDFSLSVKKNGEGILKVFWPDSQRHPWSDFSLDGPLLQGVDCHEALYDLKRILVPFRKHGRKEFAKQSEFIENVIVNHSPQRKQILGHLLKLEILKKNGSTSQYIMYPETMSKYGFNWTDIKTMTYSKGLIDFVKGFLEEVKK